MQLYHSFSFLQHVRYKMGIFTIDLQFKKTWSVQFEVYILSCMEKQQKDKQQLVW